MYVGLGDRAMSSHPDPNVALDCWPSNGDGVAQSVEVALEGDAPDGRRVEFI